MTAAQRANRDMNVEVEHDRLIEEHQIRVDAAIAQAANNMTTYPPQTIEEWNEHISKGVKPAIDYLFKRMDEEGQRHQMVKFYRSTRIFDPIYAVDLEYEDAKNLIKGLREYDPLDDDVTILKLIDSFNRFQLKAERIQNASSNIDIMQWHYDNCHGDENLEVWYDACAMVALVQPSSGASERVFSLLKQFWGDQQVHALSDTILLSLFLAYNKRSVEDFMHIME